MPPYRCTTAVAAVDEFGHDLAQAAPHPTAAAMSIECTTSANSTVTCLYSARVSCLDWRAAAVAKPRVLQRLGATRPARSLWPSSDPSANPGPRFSQDRRLDTPRGAVGFTAGDTDTKFCQCHADGVGWLAPRLDSAFVAFVFWCGWWTPESRPIWLKRSVASPLLGICRSTGPLPPTR